MFTYLTFIKLLAALLGPRAVLTSCHVTFQCAVSGKALMAVRTLIGLLTCTWVQSEYTTVTIYCVTLTYTNTHTHKLTNIIMLAVNYS